MSSLAVATVVTGSYLPFARVLAESLAEHHPGLPFFIAVVDDGKGEEIAPPGGPWTLLPFADLPLPDRPRFVFRYSRLELLTAVKPFLLRHLLDRGYASALYLDADIWVLSDLSSVLEAVRRHPILLTPHGLTPLSGPDRAARELNLLQAGVFNGGFVGVSASPAGIGFLRFWEERLEAHCRFALAEGMHYDQHWLDLAPAFFPEVAILRDPAVNVAYWNLAERDLRWENGKLLAGGRLCALFHFSGFDPASPEVISRYLPWSLEQAGAAGELFPRYREALEAAGYGQARERAWAYDSFDNGVPIPEEVRRIYRDLGDQAAAFGDPRRTAPEGSFFRWLTEPREADPDPAHGIPRLWRILYERRPDVARAYPDPLGADREGLLCWIRDFGAREHGIPEGLWPAGGGGGGVGDEDPDDHEE